MSWFSKDKTVKELKELKVSDFIPEKLKDLGLSDQKNYFPNEDIATNSYYVGKDKTHIIELNISNVDGNAIVSLYCDNNADVTRENLDRRYGDFDDALQIAAKFEEFARAKVKAKEWTKVNKPSNLKNYRTYAEEQGILVDAMGGLHNDKDLNDNAWFDESEFQAHFNKKASLEEKASNQTWANSIISKKLEEYIQKFSEYLDNNPEDYKKLEKFKGFSFEDLNESLFSLAMYEVSVELDNSYLNEIIKLRKIEDRLLYANFKYLIIIEDASNNNRRDLNVNIEDLNNTTEKIYSIAKDLNFNAEDRLMLESLIINTEEARMVHCNLSNIYTKEIKPIIEKVEKKVKQEQEQKQEAQRKQIVDQKIVEDAKRSTNNTPPKPPVPGGPKVI